MTFRETLKSQQQITIETPDNGESFTVFLAGECIAAYNKDVKPEQLRAIMQMISNRVIDVTVKETHEEFERSLKAVEPKIALMAMKFVSQNQTPKRSPWWWPL